MTDLIARLRTELVSANKHGDPDLADLLRDTLAALEAAREDACVSLVADIRFACGDNGKRMQPELVEFIRGLAVDAERWRHARRILTVEGIESSQDMFDAFGVEGDEHENRKADAAIDQARGKGVA